MAGLPDWLIACCRTALLAVLVALSSAALAVDGPTQVEIDHLLDHVRTSDLVFIRNGKEHDPEEAHRHMERKYRHFEDEVETAEQFIEHSATQSLISGKLYTIRLADGEEVVARDYLLGVLADFRATQTD